MKTFPIAAIALSIGLVLNSGQASGKESQPAAAPAVIRTNQRPEDFGYAGFAQAKTHERIDSVIKSSPAAKAGLKEGDYIVDFRFPHNAGRLFYDLRKTIVNNPGQTLLLQVKREQDGDRKQQIKLKIGNLRLFPDRKLLKALQEERKLENRAVPLTQSTIEQLPFAPDIIEIFKQEGAQSSKLLKVRLNGTKVVSLAQGSKPALTLLNSLRLPNSAVILLRDKDNRLYPQVDFENLDLPNFDRADPPQEPKYKRDWNLCCSTFGPNGGDSYIYLNQILGTWPEPLRKYRQEKPPEQSLKIALKRAIVAINENNLDTREGQKLLAGEMSYLGNSVKAGSAGVVCLDKINRLSVKDTFTRQLGDRLAVTRVGHEGKEFDSYLFFVKTDDWKLTAIRTPASSFQTYPHYDKRRYHHYGYGPNSYSKTSFFDKMSAEEKKAYTEGEHLSLLRDAALKLWFNQHKKTLTDLATMELGKDTSSTPNHKSIESRINDLRLAKFQTFGTNHAFVWLHSTRHSDCGLLYCHDKDRQAAKVFLNPYGCIWHEKLDAHWFIVRFSHRAEITTLIDNCACRSTTNQCMVKDAATYPIIEI